MVVGGSSAGAAVFSARMITGEADLQSLTAGRTRTGEGFGFWPEVVVDQHFLKQQRMNRLLSLVVDGPQLVGVGIDEETAVVVSGSEFEVIGNSNVVVIDARGADVSMNPEGAPVAAQGITLHVLKRGMRFTLAPRP